MNIERVERLSIKEFQRNYLHRGQPVIITGAISDWPAFHSWTREAIAEKFGDDTLPVEVLSEDSVNDKLYRNAKIEQMQLRHYLELAAGGGPRYYMAQVPIVRLSERMRAAFGTIDYVPKTTVQKAWSFWMGPSGAGTSLHYDISHNFVVQILGQKRWIMFPKAQHALLYMPPMDHFSPIVTEAPDLEKFPRFREATPIEFTLGPGEILFVPRLWPHRVQAIDFTVALNCFFDTPSTMLKRLPRLLRWAGSGLVKRLRDPLKRSKA